MARTCIYQDCGKKTHAQRHVCFKHLQTIDGKVTYLIKHCQVTRGFTPTYEDAKNAVKHIIKTKHDGKSTRSITDEEWDIARSML